MTVDQVIDTLKLEKQQRVPSRFPCRAIMVGNIAEYCDLLEKLKTVALQRGFSMQGKATLRQHLLRCAVMVDFVFLMELKSLLAPIK